MNLNVWGDPWLLGMNPLSWILRHQLCCRPLWFDDLKRILKFLMSPGQCPLIYFLMLPEASYFICLFCLIIIDNYFEELSLSSPGSLHTLDSPLLAQVGGQKFGFRVSGRTRNTWLLTGVVSPYAELESGKDRLGFSRVSSSERAASTFSKEPECC